MFFQKEIKSKDDLIEDLKESNIALKEEIEKLRKQINGDRCQSGFCVHCKYGLKQETFNCIGGSYTTYICELNCKCKDFERV